MFESHVAKHNTNSNFSLFTYFDRNMQLLNENTFKLLMTFNLRSIYLLPTIRPYNDMIIENLISKVTFPWEPCSISPKDYLFKFHSSSTNKINGAIKSFLSSVSADPLWVKTVEGTISSLSALGRVIHEEDEYNEATRCLIINFIVTFAANYLLESNSIVTGVMCV